MKHPEPKTAYTGRLLEQFHVLAGLIVPATKELYVEALKTGIDQSRWVLQQGEAVYTAQKKPGSIRVHDASLLYTLEAAEKTELLEEKGCVNSDIDVVGEKERKIYHLTEDGVELANQLFSRFAGILHGP